MRRKWATLLVAGFALLTFVFHEWQQAESHRAADRRIATAQEEKSHREELMERLREDNQDLAAQLAAAKELLDRTDAVTKSNTAPLQPRHCETVQSIPRGAFSGHVILKEPPAACRKFIAVVAPVTSRGKRNIDCSTCETQSSPSYETVLTSPFVLSFFNSAVRSLARSDDAGFDVAFYIACKLQSICIAALWLSLSLSLSCVAQKSPCGAGMTLAMLCGTLTPPATR